MLFMIDTTFKTRNPKKIDYVLFLFDPLCILRPNDKVVVKYEPNKRTIKSFSDIGIIKTFIAYKRAC